MASLVSLDAAIAASWMPDTAFDANECTPGNPARGQCVATALVVQYYLGGDLQKLETVFEGHPETHYRNILPDGSIKDLTRQQYPPEQVLIPAEVDLKGFPTIREKRLHDPVTRQHYELLLSRVRQRLA